MERRSVRPPGSCGECVSPDQAAGPGQRRGGLRGKKGEVVDQAAKDVQTVRQEAQGAVDHANDITAEYKQYADDKLTATELERQAAQAARTGSEAAATLAESWAVGGTGSRPGEDGNSSQFWAEKSQESAGQASREADRAAQYASIVAPGFLVDLEEMAHI